MTAKNDGPIIKVNPDFKGDSLIIISEERVAPAINAILEVCKHFNAAHGLHTLEIQAALQMTLGFTMSGDCVTYDPALPSKLNLPMIGVGYQRGLEALAVAQGSTATKQ